MLAAESTGDFSVAKQQPKRGEMDIFKTILWLIVPTKQNVTEMSLIYLEYSF